MIQRKIEEPMKKFPLLLENLIITPAALFLANSCVVDLACAFAVGDVAIVPPLMSIVVVSK